LPGQQFLFEGVDGVASGMDVTVDRQSFGFFPALDGSNFTIEEGGDFLPGVEAIGAEIGVKREQYVARVPVRIEQGL
jgi:hypothetical protein